MRQSVNINGRTVDLSRKNLIGAGGEAEVFLIGNGDQVLKLYKTPDHPDYENEPGEQKGARNRIAEHQKKLPAFPKKRPKGLIAPLDIAYETKNGPVCGFTMPFFSGADVMCEWNETDFRKQHNITKERITAMLHRLWHLVQETHDAGIVIGDFNWMNVMIERKGDNPLLIDSDSMQFGSFFCGTYTERFVDPSLCNPNEDRPILVKPHDKLSDWYAFTIQTMLLLLRTEPFGGIYRPKDKNNRLKHTARPMKRITVFDDDVLYPKPAEPIDSLPKEWITHYLRVFKGGERLQFPLDLLDSINWNGLKAIHVAKTTVSSVTGKVTYDMLIQEQAYIIHATTQGGKLLMVKGHNGQFVREDGTPILTTNQKNVRFRVRGPKTYYAYGNSLLDGDSFHVHVDMYRGKLPMFDTNSKRLFWISGGTIYREKADALGGFGQEVVGESLESQTLFWVGENFGCGFYKAGELQGAFVFNEQSGRLKDSVKLPKLKGEVVDSTCIFGKDRCWLLIAMYTGKHVENWCICINANGDILGTQNQEAGTPGWLSQIRGKTAAADFLLCATDEGIMRCGLSGQKIIEQKIFEDTENYVDTDSHLLPGPGGLYVVCHHEVGLLKIG